MINLVCKTLRSITDGQILAAEHYKGTEDKVDSIYPYEAFVHKNKTNREIHRLNPCPFLLAWLVRWNASINLRK